MRTKTNRLPASQALANAVFETLTHIAAPKRMISKWIWASDPSGGNAKHLRLSWGPDAAWEKRVLGELRRMSDHELADIGLSRSDLTLEGLAIAGSTRALRQDAVAAEIARAAKKTGEEQHGE